MYGFWPRLSDVNEATPESYPSAAEEPETARSLRKLARVTGVFLVLAVLLVPAAVVPFVTAAHQSQRLLQTGTRVPGEVTDTWMGAKGMRFMEVAYRVTGWGYAHRVEISSSRSYHPGEHVTVVADATNPLRMRTVAEPNESPGMTLTGIGFTSLDVVALILAVALVPWHLSMRRRCAANRWTRAAAGPQHTGGKRRGVAVKGVGPDVVVDQKLAEFLQGPAWVLADTCAGRPAILRTHKWGTSGGPVQVGLFSTWKPKRVRQSQG